MMRRSTLQKVNILNRSMADRVPNIPCGILLGLEMPTNLLQMSKPAFISPMKAQLVSELPTGPEWLYEVKLDGYRAEVIKDGNRVRLLSGRGNDFTRDFP